jgi:hypothetical protein
MEEYTSDNKSSGVAALLCPTCLPEDKEEVASCHSLYVNTNYSASAHWKRTGLSYIQFIKSIIDWEAIFLLEHFKGNC